MSKTKIKQELPREWVSMINSALECYETSLKLELVREEDYYTLFDIKQLKGLLEGKLTIELSLKQYENFTSNNGVDYPMFTNNETTKTEQLIINK